MYIHQCPCAYIHIHIHLCVCVFIRTYPYASCMEYLPTWTPRLVKLPCCAVHSWNMWTKCILKLKYPICIYLSSFGGVHQWGTPNEWFIMENPSYKWMMTDWGYPYDSENPQMGNIFQCMGIQSTHRITLDDTGMFYPKPRKKCVHFNALRLNSFELSQNSLTFHAGHICLLPGWGFP